MKDQRLYSCHLSYDNVTSSHVSVKVVHQIKATVYIETIFAIIKKKNRAYPHVFGILYCKQLFFMVTTFNCHTNMGLAANYTLKIT